MITIEQKKNIEKISNKFEDFIKTIVENETGISLNLHYKENGVSILVKIDKNEFTNNI